MDEATYIYRINSVYLKNGESFSPGRIPNWNLVFHLTHSIF